MKSIKGLLTDLVEYVESDANLTPYERRARIRVAYKFVEICNCYDLIKNNNKKEKQCKKN